MSSFFASTKATIGAATKSCSGPRLKRKSQIPVSPDEASTESSTPEKRPTADGRKCASSARMGATMNSDRDFSLALPRPNGL